MGLAIQRDLLADHVRAGSKEFFPESVADHDHLVLAFLVLSCNKCPAHGGTYSQHAKKVRLRGDGDDRLRFSRVAGIERAWPAIKRRAFQRPGLLLPIKIVGSDRKSTRLNSS